MTELEALGLAREVCGAFAATETTISAYALAFKDYDFAPMSRAVKESVAEDARLPTVRQIVGRYYGEKSRLRQSAAKNGDIPCEPCQREGGWFPIVGGRPVGSIQPPRAAQAPFLRHYKATTDNGGQGDTVWTGENCCPSHAKEATDKARAEQNAQEEASRKAQQSQPL